MPDAPGPWLIFLPPARLGGSVALARRRSANDYRATQDITQAATFATEAEAIEAAGFCYSAGYGRPHPIGPGEMGHALDPDRLARVDGVATNHFGGPGEVAHG